MTREKKQNLILFVGALVMFGAAIGGYRLWNDRQTAQSAWPSIDGGVYAASVTRDGITSLVPGDEVYESGVGEDGVPALTSPKYASVLASDAVIADDLPGIDLEINGEHRFYPVQILNWHYVINDTWGGKDIAITYCPLCGTPIVYDRTAGGRTLTFSVTGKVYNNNTILKDNETGSLWVQGLGMAVQGELIGTKLSTIPSAFMSWKDWKDAYPGGSVLSTNTGIARDYTRHPYGGYDTSAGVYFPNNHQDPNFGSKWVVYGVTDGTNGVGFADTVLKGYGMVEEKLGDTPIIAVYDFDLEMIRVFSVKNPDGSAMDFSYDFAKRRLTDDATGSVWNSEGVAMSGAMKGQALTEIATIRGYWFCLSSLNPAWKANISVARE